MTNKFIRIFKKYNVSKNMEEYIFGKIPIYNVGNLFSYYQWNKLVSDICKQEGLESEYTGRVLELMFKYERHESYEIYFSLFSYDTENYIKSIKYLNKVMNVDLPKAVYEYLKFKYSLSDNFELLKYFYEKDRDAIRLVFLKYYKEFTDGLGAGGFTYQPTDNILSYLMVMKEIDYEFLKEKILNRIDRLYNYELMSFYVYLPFFKYEEHKDILLRVISVYLDERNASDDIKNVVLEYLKIGEKNKKFDKLVKKIATHNKKYNIYIRLSDIILYKKPIPDNIYEQRLITLSMHIDKYRTIKRFLFSIYSDEDKMKVLRNELIYEVNKSDMDELIKNWESISYENIIDYLTYHIALEYYGLDAKKFFEMYLKENFDKTIDSLKLASGKGLEAVLNIVYDYDKKKTNDFILNNISIFKGKSLINKVVEIILMERDNNKLIELIKHKKSNVREIVVRTLIKINNKNTIEILKKLRRTESSKAILELLNEYLNIFDDVKEEYNYFSKSEIMKRADIKKLQNIDEYSGYPLFVWREDGSDLSDIFTKYLFYLLKRGDKKTFLASTEAQKILSLLTSESIINFIDFLDENEKLSEPILRMMSCSGTDKYLGKLKNHINKLVYENRRSVAAKVVSLIASFKTRKAVKLLDFLSVRKNVWDKRVNKTALAEMENIAKEMNLSKDELLDFTVPDFGFDKNGKLVLDFGPRQFTVRLQSDLSMLITDNNGKKFKNLPKINKNDDTIKWYDASELFKSIKKKLKKQVKLESERLERGFSESRFWSGENWLKLFVNNPIMRQFAMNLVWGKYKNDVLTDSFRYLDDDSFSNIEDEELNIENSDTISFVHPVELSIEQLDAWMEILDDYEIIQPFEQITRPVFKPSDSDGDKTVIDSFKGYMINRFTLRKNLLKLGWNRGVVKNAGCFYYYDKSYSDGTNVNLDFLGDYVGNYDDNMEVPIYDITLTKNGEKLKLSEISPRLYSELYYELKKITEKGSGFNKEWEKVSW